MHPFHKKLCLIPGYYGIEQAGSLAGIAAIALKTGGRMVGQLGNLVVNQIRMSGNDEQRMLLVTLMKHLYSLGGGELENNGVQCTVPAEQDAGSHKDAGIGTENIIPDILAAFFGKINGKEIGATAAGIADQTKADGKAVDQPSENADQQRIIGDRLCREQVSKHTGKKDHTTGTDGELLADKAEAYVNRNAVQQDIDHSVRDLKS